MPVSLTYRHVYQKAAAALSLCCTVAPATATWLLQSCAGAVIHVSYYHVLLLHQQHVWNLPLRCCCMQTLLQQMHGTYQHATYCHMLFADPGDVPFEDESGFKYWPSPSPSSNNRLSEDPNMFKYAWVEQYSEDLQRPYYYNQETKESTWERPADLAWRRVKIADS